MTVTKNAVVSIIYDVKTDDGDLVDKVEKNDPLEYLHGHENIIPGLEKALHGKKVGEKVNVTIKPKEAYGEYNESLVQRVAANLFETEEELEVGMRFIADTDQGPLPVEITKIDGEEVVIDGNHMLADQTLVFDVEILSTRDATDEEIEHGHVHNGDCGE